MLSVCSTAPIARHGEVGLEVLLVVPHERADPLVAGHAEAAQGVRELGSAPADVCVRCDGVRRRRSR